MTEEELKMIKLIKERFSDYNDIQAKHLLKTLAEDAKKKNLGIIEFWEFLKNL